MCQSWSRELNFYATSDSRGVEEGLWLFLSGRTVVFSRVNAVVLLTDEADTKDCILRRTVGYRCSFTRLWRTDCLTLSMARTLDSLRSAGTTPKPMETPLIIRLL
jgi:hypothetical protein